MKTYLTSEASNSALQPDQMLEQIQNRVLWLAVKMVHFANQERFNDDGIKVGGHQASSASAVTILTSLFFDHMTSGDRISVKPHASPIFHAIQYLLGNLDRNYLERFREFHGLQSYPSRTKDPDGVDFSTGSVGLGSIAPNFAALVEGYLATHSIGASPHKFIALVGDAELDEGSVWETIVEPHLQQTPNILWVVDLNRQSLDRVISGIRVNLWREMFAANGWNVIDAKYGSRLQGAFEEPRGELLRESIDAMPNEVYQRLLRSQATILREWLPRFSSHPNDLTNFLHQRDDNTLSGLVQNLGGHDFSTLRSAFSEAERSGRPSVVFAYTLKGWRLPSIGDHQNHSVLLTPAQMEELQVQCGIKGDPWASFDQDSPEGEFCALSANRLRAGKNPPPEPRFDIPTTMGRGYTGKVSTQQAFGYFLVGVARDLPQLAQRIVTASPDVASSTNLGGWINRSGVWNRTTDNSIPDDNTLRSLKWTEGPNGNHIELGISESNLFMLLGQLGLTSEMHGHTLFPIGTLYDPFVCRGLEAFQYGLYAGSKFIVVGTPSGITLSREGGAHQSIVTPSIGVGMPDLLY